MVRYLPFFLLLTLYSCNFAPRYSRMVDEVPQEWRVVSDDTPTIANMNWWKELNDPVLNDLIVEALDNNKDLKIAIARVYEFWAIYGQVRSFLLPEIDGQGSFVRQELSNAAQIIPFPANVSRTFNLYSLFATLSYELDVWGRIRNLTEAAMSSYIGQIDTRRTVVLTLVSAVASAYIQLLQYDRQLKIAKDTYESRVKSYKLALVRFDEGLTSELEVEQAAAESQEALARVKQFEILVPQQENLISVLIGHNPESIPRGRNLETLDMPPSVPAGLPSDLLEQRPDILVAEQQVIAANALIGAAKAAYFPTISLTGVYGNSSIELHKLFTAGARQWDYQAAFLMPLFNYGRTGYQVEQAEMEKLEALYNYQKVIQNAFKEVDDALIEHRITKELVTVQTERVRVLKRSLFLATLRYENGQTDYLNVLDAERSLFNAQLDLAEAQANSFLTYVSLYKALGGGWVIAADREAIVCP